MFSGVLTLSILGQTYLIFCCSGPAGLNYVGSTEKKKKDHVTKRARYPLPTSNNMAESVSKGQLWLAVKVVSGSRILFSFKIISCTEAKTFGGVLSRLEGEHSSERCIEKVVIVKNSPTKCS